MSQASSAAARWRGILEAFRDSGLSQADFCRERGLSLHTLRKHLYGRRNRPTRATPVEFVPVVAADPGGPAPSPRRDDPIVLILGGGRRVAVAPGFDADTLRRLVDAVEGLA